MTKRAVLVTLAVAIGVLSPPVGAQEQQNRAQWFRQARWGVFTHYMADTVLAPETLSVETWNAAVDSFDVNAMANLLDQIGAGYYIITLGQNSGYYCSPNAAYDRLTAISPSKCSRRDLVADLYGALQPKGIRLMVYLPSGAPDRDPEAVKALGWQRGNDGPDPRLASFQRKWEDVIREWSLRWGPKVSGWWFDGCYYAGLMYNHADEPNFKSFAGAARAGNPGSILAFNPGVKYPIVTLTPEEDYTAGEIEDVSRVVCTGPLVNQAQFHMLSYLGPRWAASPPRFTDEQAAGMMRAIIEKGGVVSWDVPIKSDGQIPEPFAKQLAAIGNALRK
ncbi:MAG: alpha-L-fucosidase [Candidatus Hydrogenedentes bacterium]|nr:alpha-L-fucosidase [Candidatus Hydrogenedentota bacterium]